MKKLLVIALITFSITLPVYALDIPEPTPHKDTRVYMVFPTPAPTPSRSVAKVLKIASAKLDSADKNASIHTRVSMLFNYIWDANMIIGDIKNDVDQRLKGAILSKKKLESLKSKLSTDEYGDFLEGIGRLRRDAISLLYLEESNQGREEMGLSDEFLEKTILKSSISPDISGEFTQATYHKTVFKASERGIIDTYGFEVFDHFTGKTEIYWSIPFPDDCMTSGKSIPQWEQDIFTRTDAKRYLGTVLRIYFGSDGTMHHYEVIERFKTFE